MERRTLALVLALAVVLPAARVRAEERPTKSDATEAEEKPKKKKAPAKEVTRLEEVVVEAKKPVSAASSDEIRARDYELRPHATTQEILNNIPGLVVAQHQGGGKATQWLIRGFDADHGTDIAVFIDDLPINLRTHAHGQGYADMNPLIPEVVDTIQLRKGPYFAEYGDFANAGALNVVTKDQFKEDFALAEGGSFDVMRYAGGASGDFHGVKSLFAGQAYFADGPFENPQDFSRYNAFTKFTLDPTSNSKAWLSSSIYDGEWHGSGQIPLRAVHAGFLDRFGAIDPTEGGHSDREDLNFHYDLTPSEQDRWEVQTYGTRYKLQLFTDFTFFRDTGERFTEDPSGNIHDTEFGGHVVGRDDLPFGASAVVPGDGIEQNDQRYLYGGRVRYTRFWSVLGLPVETRVAVETRNDDIDVALARQVRRNIFYTINKLNVSERSVSPYLTNEVFFTDWIRLEFGLRGDVFFVDGRNRLPRQRKPCPVDPVTGATIRDGKCEPNFAPVPISGTTEASMVSPKANLVISPRDDTDVYLNFGEGFHSNDARNALTSLQTGDSSLLVKSLGYELGARTRQLDKLDLAAALWLLDLDSELVFSGDAGNQETGSSGGNLVPSPSTRRWGVDFETRYDVTHWLTADYDLGWADPRYTGTAADGSIKKGDAVALAPTLLMNGGLTARFGNGFSIALRSRYLDDRPAIPDRSIPARGYFLMDLLASYRWRNVEASIDFLNLTNTDWREAQFVDNTCLHRELGNAQGCDRRPGQQTSHLVEPRNDIHFTPGNPFGVRAGIKIYFN